MIAQRKKVENKILDQSRIEDFKADNPRPNIDHLLKKITIERKTERRNNLMIMIVGIFAIAVVSFIFTQAQHLKFHNYYTN